MKRTAVLAPVVVCLAALLAGCGGSGSPTASSPTPTPTPSPTLPPVATDKAMLKAALVKPADLGPKWVQPKDVNKVKNTGKDGVQDFCPGHPTAFDTVKARAHEAVNLTNGTQAGADIASFDLYAYDPALLSQVYDAVLAVAQACKQWKAAEGNYDVVTLYPAVQMAQADRSAALLESVYADAAHKQLQYVRQLIVAQVGRVVSVLERAYLTPKSDPKGTDFTETQRLMGIQLDKVIAQAKS